MDIVFKTLRTLKALRAVRPEEPLIGSPELCSGLDVNSAAGIVALALRGLRNPFRANFAISEMCSLGNILAKRFLE